MVGRSISVQQVINEIERDIPFYDQSGGGVTFTGGEPMFQTDFLAEMLHACKNLGIHTIVDTSGYAPWEGFESIHPLVDLFLYDVKLIDELKHIKYTSMSNRMILENLRRLSELRAHIIVRIPLIPKVNDGDNIEQIASFLAELPHLEGIELMPYHGIGLAKYPALGMKYNLPDIEPPTPQQIAEVENMFIHSHLPIKVQFSGRTV
jgi:pyruvate formate lyase activating enzyme